MEEIQKENEIIFNNNLKNNEEALALREIFNIIEEEQRIAKKEVNLKKNFFYKFNINGNSNIINIINDMPNRQKNRHKMKLQKIFVQKNLKN